MMNLLLKLSAMLACGGSYLGWSQPAYAQDPGRVRVAITTGSTGVTYGKTVVAADGQRLRGNWCGVSKAARLSGDQNDSGQEAYWQQLKAVGANFSRIVCWDVFDYANGRQSAATNFSDPVETEQFLGDLDVRVNFAAKYNISVMINAHVGDVTGDAYEYRQQFWRVVAPRYANRTHVFYELVNEPVGLASDLIEKDGFMDRMVGVHDLVRDLAPDTMLVLFTPVNFSSYWKGNPNTLKAAADLFNTKTGKEDWNKLAIGFHSYNAQYQIDETGTSQLRETMQTYAVINTEANFPQNVFVQGRNGDPGQEQYFNLPFDNEPYITQTMERLGISWSMWFLLRSNEVRANWPLIVNDAKNNNYWWQSAPGLENGATYRLRNAWANKDLSASGTNDGASVVTYSRNDPWESQKWVLEQVSGNIFRLRNAWANKLLRATNNLNQAGVDVFTRNDAWGSELWYLENIGGNQFRLRNFWTAIDGQYLSANGTSEDASVVVYAKNDAWESQKWFLDLVSSGNGDPSNLTVS